MTDPRYNFRKICRIGSLKDIGSVFIKIEYFNGKLSITGVEGPMYGGNAKGSYGQIIMSYKHYDGRGYLSLNDILVNTDQDWTLEKIEQLFDIWDEYHNNELQSCCEHQRKLGWDKEPIDPTRPTTDYDKFDGEKSSWNLKVWAYPPHGHMCEPCPTCGYKCGTAWLKKEIPNSVFFRLTEFPETDIQPAWI